MTLDELKTVRAPFKVRCIRTGKSAVVKGFAQNDPLGVGGGLLPDQPVVYFKSGGWLLLENFLDGYALHHVARAALEESK